MPKYLITIKELSPSDVEWDRQGHTSAEYVRPTRHSSIKAEFLMTAAVGSTSLADIKADILTQIGVRET